MYAFSGKSGKANIKKKYGNHTVIFGSDNEGNSLTTVKYRDIS